MRLRHQQGTDKVQKVKDIYTHTVIPSVRMRFHLTWLWFLALTEAARVLRRGAGGFHSATVYTSARFPFPQASGS